MNEEAIFEIGDLIHVRYKLSWKSPFFKKLTAQEILESYEYKIFRVDHLNLCKLVEASK